MIKMVIPENLKVHVNLPNLVKKINPSPGNSLEKILENCFLERGTDPVDFMQRAKRKYDFNILGTQCLKFD